MKNQVVHEILKYLHRYYNWYMDRFIELDTLPDDYDGRMEYEATAVNVILSFIQGKQKRLCKLATQRKEMTNEEAIQIILLLEYARLQLESGWLGYYAEPISNIFKAVGTSGRIPKDRESGYSYFKCDEFLNIFDDEDFTTYMKLGKIYFKTDGVDPLQYLENLVTVREYIWNYISKFAENYDMIVTHHIKDGSVGRCVLNETLEDVITPVDRKH